MAALRGALRSSFTYILRNPNPNPRFALPSRLVATRGVASKLFVGGLTEEESLSESFSQFGQVIEAKIVMDKASERSKGFGFITFASQDEADRAISKMNSKILNGRTVFVDYSKPNPPPSKNHFQLRGLHRIHQPTNRFLILT